MIDGANKLIRKRQYHNKYYSNRHEKQGHAKAHIYTSPLPQKHLPNPQKGGRNSCKSKAETNHTVYTK